MANMFTKLFMRGKSEPPQERANLAPAPTAAREPPVEPPEPPKASNLESFKEQWAENWEPHSDIPSPEVIEGNGGNTDWGMWTEAVKAEEDAFAPTEPMPLRPAE